MRLLPFLLFALYLLLNAGCSRSSQQQEALASLLCGSSELESCRGFRPGLSQAEVLALETSKPRLADSLGLVYSSRLSDELSMDTEYYFGEDGKSVSMILNVESNDVQRTREVLEAIQIRLGKYYQKLPQGSYGNLSWQDAEDGAKTVLQLYPDQTGLTLGIYSR